jgi:hypothetical protein
LTKKSKLDLHAENNYEYLNNVSVLFIYPDKFNAKKNYDFFYFKNIFNNIPCSAPNCMHIFDHTVKPVLLYASEIVGLFNNNKNVGVNSNNDSHFNSNLYSRNS